MLVSTISELVHPVKALEVVVILAGETMGVEPVVGPVIPDTPIEVPGAAAVLDGGRPVVTSDEPVGVPEVEFRVFEMTLVLDGGVRAVALVEAPEFVFKALEVTGMLV